LKPAWFKSSFVYWCRNIFRIDLEMEHFQADWNRGETPIVMARLFRATYRGRVLAEVARTSRAMTVSRRPPPFQSARTRSSQNDSLVAFAQHLHTAIFVPWCR
jgi:hypothetical protein